jgi:ClpP class serine protease
MPCEITSIGPTGRQERQHGGVFYSRRGAGGVIATIRLTGILGHRLNALDIEEELFRAQEDALRRAIRCLTVLCITSPGGLVDDVIETVGPAIQAVRSAGGMVAAHISHAAYGCAGALALGWCSPVILHPTARIGFLAVQPSPFSRTGPAQLQAELFSAILKARPNVKASVLERLTATAVIGEHAEAAGLADAIGTETSLFAGRCRR